MPLLSVIIPTRNRTRYLLDSVQVVLANTTDAEVIIHDNSDTDDAAHQLADVLASGRVRYFHSGESLSVVGNFEHALSKATGDYLIFIGDDDAIGPGLQDIAQWAKENAVDAVVSYTDKFLASYFWPGVQSKYFGNAYSSQLFVHDFSGRVSLIDAKSALRTVAAKLGGGLGALPRAYHGMISKDLVQRIRARHGHLFGGVSPDIYSATLITANLNNAVVVDYPFVIPGASPSSTAGQGAARSDRGSLRSTEHIARFGQDLKWNDAIPAFYAPHTVWAYSLCAALDQVPDLEVVPSYGRLYASCLIHFSGHANEVRDAMRHLARTQGWARVIGGTVAGLFGEARALAVRFLSRLMHPRAGGAARKSGPHDTISAAYCALNDDIQSRQLRLQLPAKL